jgi:hypothetical protein
MPAPSRSLCPAVGQLVRGHPRDQQIKQARHAAGRRPQGLRVPAGSASDHAPMLLHLTDTLPFRFRWAGHAQIEPVQQLRGCRLSARNWLVTEATGRKVKHLREVHSGAERPARSIRRHGQSPNQARPLDGAGKLSHP